MSHHPISYPVFATGGAGLATGGAWVAKGGAGLAKGGVEVCFYKNYNNFSVLDITESYLGSGHSEIIVLIHGANQRPWPAQHCTLLL